MPPVLSLYLMSQRALSSGSEKRRSSEHKWPRPNHWLPPSAEPSSGCGPRRRILVVPSGSSQHCDLAHVGGRKVRF
jgi:hypothetical protein